MSNKSPELTGDVPWAACRRHQHGYSITSSAGCHATRDTPLPPLESFLGVDRLGAPTTPSRESSGMSMQKVRTPGHERCRQRGHRIGRPPDPSPDDGQVGPHLRASTPGELPLN
jgi:hypothetical protein